MTAKEYVKQHKHIYYCEAIIYPDGSIEDAVPSHSEKLYSVAMSMLGVSRSELYTRMPMIASPVHWCVGATKCIAVWYECGVCENIVTDAQRESWALLSDLGYSIQNMAVQVESIR